MPINEEEYRQLRAQGVEPAEAIKQLSKQTQRKIGIEAETPFGGFIRGATKGIGSTLFGAGKLGQQIAKQTAGRSIEALTGIPKEQLGTQFFEQKPEILEPIGRAQKIGFATEKVAEFLAPSSKIAQLEKGTRLLTRSFIEAAANSTIASVQKGRIDESKNVAFFSAMFPIGGTAISSLRPTLGRGLQKVGEKIVTTVIRPTIQDIKDGFKSSSLTKYNIVGNTTEEFLAVAQKQIKEKGGQLSLLVKNAFGNKKIIDLNKTFETTKRILVRSRRKEAFGDISSLRNGINKLQEEILDVARNKLGRVTFQHAQEIKQGAGLKGAWAYGRPDPDGRIAEKIYTTFYRVLKKQMENVGPKQMRRLNKELHEIIPIMHAVTRRLPVEARNNVLSLTDSLGLYAAVFDPRALAIIGAKKLSRSGKLGGWLAQTGQRLQQTSQRGAIRERIFGGGGL